MCPSEGRKFMKLMKKNPITTIVAIGIGAALFFVLGRFVSIPSPVANTNISTQYGLLAFMAALYGPLAGFLIAFIGHTLIDFSYGWGIWWSWVIASGIAGLVMGLLTMGISIEDSFGKKEAITLNIGQIVANIIAWGVIAPVFDILIYAEPANKVFTQGIVAGLVNIVTTAVIATLLSLAYNKAKPKAGSLRKED